MNISQVSKLTGLSAKSIRFYEDKGIIKPPVRLENGYRDYADDQIEQLRIVASLARPDEPRAGPRAPAVAGLSPGATALTSSFPPDPGHSARRVRYASRKHARRGGLGGGPIRPGRKARIPDDRHAVHVPARNRERAITGAPADGTGYRVTGISPFAPFPRLWAD